MGARHRAGWRSSRSSSCSSPPATTTSSFARLIDARLHGERAARAAARLRPAARAAARPVAHRAAARRSPERPRLRGAAKRGKPGEFTVGNGVVVDHPRRASFKGELVRVVFQPPARPARKRRDGHRRRRQPIASLRLELGEEGHASGSRSTHRCSRSTHRRRARKAAAGRAVGDPAARGPGGARDRGSPLLLPPGRRSDPADRRDRREPHRQSEPDLGDEHDHAAAGAQRLPAAVRRAGRWRRARERSVRREGARAVWLSLVLDTRASKDEILEMYLNDMPLGQRGSFAIFGVPRPRGCSSARTSATSRSPKPRRWRASAVAVGAVAVQQPGAVPRAPQRGAAGDGRRRLHHGGSRPTRAARSRSSSCSARSKPRRRTSSTTSPRRSTTTTRA